MLILAEKHSTLFSVHFWPLPFHKEKTVSFTLTEHWMTPCDLLWQDSDTRTCHPSHARTTKVSDFNCTVPGINDQYLLDAFNSNRDSNRQNVNNGRVCLSTCILSLVYSTVAYHSHWYKRYWGYYIAALLCPNPEWKTRFDWCTLRV